MNEQNNDDYAWLSLATTFRNVFEFLFSRSVTLHRRTDDQSESEGEQGPEHEE